MNNTEKRDLLIQLDVIDEAWEEAGFVMWVNETVFAPAVNRWIHEIGGSQ